jgi:uncharacterized protein YbaR (Trm112 family)
MFDDLICPKCRHDMSYISETRKSKFLEFKKGSYHSYYDGSFSGHRWTEIITCRKCGNKWEVENSDI